jgi:hypothetical protein
MVCLEKCWTCDGNLDPIVSSGTSFGSLPPFDNLRVLFIRFLVSPKLLNRWFWRNWPNISSIIPHIKEYSGPKWALGISVWTILPKWVPQFSEQLVSSKYQVDPSLRAISLTSRLQLVVYGNFHVGGYLVLWACSHLNLKFKCEHVNRPIRLCSPQHENCRILQGAV